MAVPVLDTKLRMGTPACSFLALMNPRMQLAVAVVDLQHLQQGGCGFPAFEASRVGNHRLRARIAWDPWATMANTSNVTTGTSMGGQPSYRARTSSNGITVIEIANESANARIDAAHRQQEGEQDTAKRDRASKASGHVRDDGHGFHGPFARRDVDTNSHWQGLHPFEASACRVYPGQS
jgi:hypothetical protein